MSLQETYFSGNRDIELIERNGWWEMRPIGEAPEAVLAIAVLFHTDFGWGYWDHDREGNSTWVEIDVPEKDPAKLHESPNNYELGRYMAYVVGKEMTAERIVELITLNCERPEEREECLRGIKEARVYWGYDPIEVSASDLE